MKLANLFENADVTSFDEKFIRDVAADRGIDLSSKSTEDILRMHEQILRNIGDRDSIEGQDYYDDDKGKA